MRGARRGELGLNVLPDRRELGSSEAGRMYVLVYEFLCEESLCHLQRRE